MELADGILARSQQLRLDDCNSSPLDLFLKRQIKPLTHLSPGKLTNLPEEKKWSWEGEVELREKARQARQDRGQKLKNLPELKIGDRVLVQDPHNKKWYGPAFVTEQCVSKGSYWVKQDADFFRKHRSHLRLTPAPDPEYSQRLKRGIFISDLISEDSTPPPAGDMLMEETVHIDPGQTTLPDNNGLIDPQPEIDRRVTRSMTRK